MNLNRVTPLLLAALYSPVIPSGLLSALTVGKLLGHLPASWAMVIGQLAYTVGSILIATMPRNQIYWANFFRSVAIICIGMDSSFPAATIIFSGAVDQKFQGIGASFILTVVNYSISIGLAFAGTVERYITIGSGSYADLEKGYRGAFYMEIGFAGLGLVLSLLFVIKGFWARWLTRGKKT